MTFLYRFESETKPITPPKLEVETNTREQLCVLGPRPARFQVDSPWHSGAADVLTYEPEELLGTKLRALYQRKKGGTSSISPRRSPESSASMPKRSSPASRATWRMTAAASRARSSKQRKRP